MNEMKNQDEINQQRDAFEAKIRKIDEQIALLNDLKTQCLAQLHSLPGTVPQPATSISNQSLDKKLLYSKIISVAGRCLFKLWINNRTGKRGIVQFASMNGIVFCAESQPSNVLNVPIKDFFH